VPANPNADPVSREAYTHEVVSFGFWPGDLKVREPMYYSYTAPAPAGLAGTPLRPEQAGWNESGSLALLPYEAVRSSADPRSALIGFLESAYQAGAGLACWKSDDLRSTWCREEG
jgi:hypothetical protein